MLKARAEQSAKDRVRDGQASACLGGKMENGIGYVEETLLAELRPVEKRWE